MSNTSDRLDGIEFTGYRGRFNGTVELEEIEAKAAAIRKTLVFVGVAEISDALAKLDKKTGELNRINVFTVTDARVLDDELRTLLVERLGLFDGGQLDGSVSSTPIQVDVTFGADVTTGEIHVPDDIAVYPEQTTVIGHISDARFGPSEKSSPGPRTVPFSQHQQQEFNLGEKTTIGQVVVRDSVLQRALDDPTGWR